ncbi:glycoside hydrolase superfamily [Cytidiella melzeri]|nr:glycoside hydrolase superfamily [Cytidiella melzeri]
MHRYRDVSARSSLPLSRLTLCCSVALALITLAAAHDCCFNISRSHFIPVCRYSWDVVNETFNDDGTWRTDVFYNTLGTSYVQIALTAARAAVPTAKLYINDYNIEYPGAKSTAMQTLVQTLKPANVPLDGIGLQNHWILGELPSASTLEANMNAFTAPYC